MSHIRRRAVSLLCLALLCLVAGCVTTRSGPLPQPASEKIRMQAQLDLARGYLGNRDFERAREPIRRVLEMNSRSIEALMLQAAVEQGEGEFELAEATYRRALRYEPRNAQALTNYGGYLLSRRRHEEALPKLRQAVKDNEYYLRAQSFEYLGRAELAVGDRPAATHAFERAVGLNAEQAGALLELADIKFADGELDVAAQLYDQLRASSGPSARSLCLGMHISRALNDQDALSSYRLALKNLFPRSRQARTCDASGT